MNDCVMMWKHRGIDGTTAVLHLQCNRPTSNFSQYLSAPVLARVRPHDAMHLPSLGWYVPPCVDDFAESSCEVCLTILPGRLTDRAWTLTGVCCTCRRMMPNLFELRCINCKPKWLTLNIPSQPRRLRSGGRGLALLSARGHLPMYI